MQDAQGGKKYLRENRYLALQSCQEIWLRIQQHLDELLPGASAATSTHLQMAAPSPSPRLPPGPSPLQRTAWGLPCTPRGSQRRQDTLGENKGLA